MVDRSILLLLFLVVILWSTTPSATQENSKGPRCHQRHKDAEVLILGAGMSGVSAAKTLTDGGITDFLMFEGRGEIGGRVRTGVKC